MSVASKADERSAISAETNISNHGGDEDVVDIHQVRSAYSTVCEMSKRVDWGTELQRSHDLECCMPIAGEPEIE